MWKFYTHCVILHILCNLRCFVASKFLSRIHALLSVKFPSLKMCGCKKNDKYEVCWILGCAERRIDFRTSFFLSYDQLRADTSSAHSFTLLKNFFTYVDDLESASISSTIHLSEFFKITYSPTEMEKRADTADISVLFFPGCANVLAVYEQNS